MDFCQICFHYKQDGKIHYGAEHSCKACAKVFLRYVREKPALKCKEKPELFGECIRAAELCRKCRLDRCYEKGMNENYVTREPVPKKKNKPLSQLSHRAHAKLRRPTVSSSARQLTVPGGYQGSYNVLSEWHQNIQPFSAPIFNHAQVVMAIQTAIPTYFYSNLPFNHEYFPLMSSASKELILNRRIVEDRYPHRAAIQGALEHGEQFLSMTKHFQMIQNIEGGLKRMLEVFQPFSGCSSDMMEAFFSNARMYYGCLISSYWGFTNAQRVNSQWLINNRNFPVPCIYIERTRQAFYVCAKRSLPYAEDDECRRIGDIRYEMRLDAARTFDIPIGNNWLFDENCFHAFISLLVLDVSVDYCKDDRIRNALFQSKQALIGEIRSYFQMYNVNVPEQMGRVECFLKTTKDLIQRSKQQAVELKQMMAQITTRFLALDEVEEKLN
ncbi:hypothetical protein QR680_014683 [Steinernema hermaphroditum]|uniref:Nuclear receptor domain-containing protein n=1 Tax=Steinernema hermaphroditum TaxID=289476 RepID=A0AA39M3N1_9BILA|nr:hypothetical protein QR680_014683 [Steinernema hermaphroditum]